MPIENYDTVEKFSRLREHLSEFELTKSLSIDASLTSKVVLVQRGFRSKEEREKTWEVFKKLKTVRRSGVKSFQHGM